MIGYTEEQIEEKNRQFKRLMVDKNKTYLLYTENERGDIRFRMESRNKAYLLDRGQVWKNCKFCNDFAVVEKGK